MLDGPRVDPVKLVLLLHGTGADGNVVEAGLVARGMPVEMADRDTLVPMLTLADDDADLETFEQALVEEIDASRGPARPVAPAAAWTVVPEQARSPREAFFAARERRPLAEALGRTSAELVAPYPPGVPVLAPGERVTREALAALEAARASGVRIAYSADPTLETLWVLEEH